MESTPRRRIGHRRTRRIGHDRSRPIGCGGRTTVRRRPAGLLAIQLAAVPAACQQDDSAKSPAIEIRDSAGVRIVENERPAEDSRLQLRIGPEPSVSIGGVAGEDPYLLDGANDAAVLPDGRIVVANGGTSELRVFDSGGAHLATWGGEGEGPGEFTSLAAVGRWRGDSVVAWNRSTWVVSIFNAEGAFGRSFVLDSEAGALEPRAVLGDRSILGRTGEPVSRTGGPVSGMGYRRSRETYQLRHAETASTVEFGSHPGRESYLAILRGMPVLGLLPFGRSLQEAEWGELVIITPDDDYEVRAYERTTGALARIVRREHENRAPTRGEVDDALDEALARAGLSGPRLDAARQGYRNMPLVERFPAFLELLTDPLDHLWVREAALPGTDRPAPLWTVFDPEGRALGFVETPDGLAVFEIGADYLLGRATDELGVESVQVWGLER